MLSWASYGVSILRIGEKTDQVLTHWGRVTHICVGKLTIIGSDNGLSPGRRQAIIWTNAAILLIGPLGTNFSEILIKIYTFSFKKMHLKMSSAKWRPFCCGLNVLKGVGDTVQSCRCDPCISMALLPESYGDCRAFVACWHSIPSHLVNNHAVKILHINAVWMHSTCHISLEQSVFSAAENAKSWVAQRTTHDWWCGGPSQFWMVHKSIICWDREINWFD